MSDYNTAPGSTTGSKPGSSSSSSGGSGGSSSKYDNPDRVTGAESRANAREAKARRDAAAKYRRQAETLQGQIKALRAALTTGFKKALDQRLRNAALTYKQQDKVLMDSYKSRLGDLSGSASDNQKAAGDQAFANLSNRGRERAAAVSEAMNQGAGESDLLRSQMMSLRNWGANQQEGQRAFFDGLRSINSALGDLNADTKTGRVNLATQWNADRDALYTDYFNRRSDTYTQLGNILGQQSDLYSSAIEMGGHDRKRQRATDSASEDAFMAASKEASRAWKNPGVSSALMKWSGAKDFEGETNLSNINNVQTVGPSKKPEGAALRSW